MAGYFWGGRRTYGQTASTSSRRPAQAARPEVVAVVGALSHHSIPHPFKQRQTHPWDSTTTSGRFPVQGSLEEPLRVRDMRVESMDAKNTTVPSEPVHERTKTTFCQLGAVAILSLLLSSSPSLSTRPRKALSSAGHSGHRARDSQVRQRGALEKVPLTSWRWLMKGPVPNAGH